MNLTIGKYKFLGKPDNRFPLLKTGKAYVLVIEYRHWGFLDWLRGITHPQIIGPFQCPYTNQATFNKNWKKLNWTQNI